jgi:hypothetical protein
MSEQCSHLREVHVTRLWIISLAWVAALWPQILSAQSPNESTDPVRVGDQWVYDTKDEITGYPKDTFSEIVTEVSPKEIIVSTTFSGKDLSILVVYDHDWNRLENPVVKFKPNDGQGVRLPLSVGKEWRTEYDERNRGNGAAFRAVAVSKVVAQETVTTPAGTFETFKIERRIKHFNSSNPSRPAESQTVFWYAPEVNHWVRRTYQTKIDKRTRFNMSDELTDFSRNP